MNEKKLNKKLIIFILCLLAISLFFIIIMKNNNLKNNESNKADKLKKVKEEWYVPVGNANRINIYFNNVLNNVVASKEEAYVNSFEYKIIGTYNCVTSSCKSYDFNINKDEVIIKDDYYVIYNYKKNKAYKLSLPSAEYNSIDFLSYENKDYGLSVSNINGLYAFYSLEKQEFTTDFKYSNIFVSEKAGLIKGNISVAINDNDVSKYYIVSYENGEVLKTSDAYLGSFGNKDNVYYYENYESLDGYNAVIYDSTFKKILSDYKYSDFSVTKSGNLIVKKEDENLFSIYNKEGKLVKESKDYKEIFLLSNDYVSVVDVDDYLKIVDVDGNIVSKCVKIDDNTFLNKSLSGVRKRDSENGIFVRIEKTSGTMLDCYYISKTKESGISEIIN